ncbi:MAG: hypothetical protein ACXV5D_08590, partial [Halobacteriota archaeon]
IAGGQLLFLFDRDEFYCVGHAHLLAITESAPYDREVLPPLLLKAASERKLPSLSWAFGAQAFLEQFWIIKTLVYFFFCIASYTIHAAILINLERIEPLLKIWHNDLIAPLAGRVISSVMVSTPALKTHTVNLPPCYVHDTPG